MTLNEDFRPAVRAITIAGNAARALRARYPAVLSSRSARDAQRTVDDQADEFIRASLDQDFPGVPIISEEDASHSVSRPAEYWLIDPIDGTASWSSGFPGYVSQVAFIRSGHVQFGAIHAPVLGLTWTGCDGSPAQLNGVPMRALEHSTRRIVIDNYPKPRGLASSLVGLLPATSYRESGSIGLKGARVCNGDADVFAKDVILRDWDVAPLAPIARAVGAYVGTLDGQHFVFDGPFEKRKGYVIARTEELYRRVVAIAATRQS
jgi:3'(2'), 5'-bisphosphate nucleotidase